MAHVMVVGDTPILKRVALFLAEHDNVVTLVGEDVSRLQKIKAESGTLESKIKTLQLNRQDTTGLFQELSEMVQQYGPVTLAVNWSRNVTGDIHRYFAQFLNTTSPVCRYFQVVASESGQINVIPGQMDAFKDFEKVLYRKVTIGYPSSEQYCELIEPDAVANGIIEAIRNDARDAMIGSESWEERQQSA